MHPTTWMKVRKKIISEERKNRFYQSLNDNHVVNNVDCESPIKKSKCILTFNTSIKGNLIEL